MKTNLRRYYRDSGSVTYVIVRSFAFPLNVLHLDLSDAPLRKVKGVMPKCKF